MSPRFSRHCPCKAFKALCLVLLVICGAVLSPTEAAWAKKKKKPKVKKPPIVSSLDIFEVTVKIKNGKKTTQRAVTCYEKQGGKTKQTKRGLEFHSFARELSRLKKQGKDRTKRYFDLARLEKLSRSECKNPDFLSLTRFDGTFGEDEARILYNRFAFGASPEEIQLAVSTGLEATVNRLLTFVAEPELASQMDDLMCDQYFKTLPWNGEIDDRNRDDEPEHVCNPNNGNDVSMTGTRYAILWRMARTQNPLFHRLWFFLHDERMSAAHDVLNGSERYALKAHIQMLERAVASGDMVQYSRDWNSDYLGSLKYLDNGLNRGYGPNENYAREFWELLTIGPANLDGIPNYGVLDIAQAALAHSGWVLRYSEEEIPGETEDVGFTLAFFAPPVPPGSGIPYYHAPGIKKIFIGTPYEASVDTAEDVLQATIRHPRFAEYLAEDLSNEFIGKNMPAQFIKALAASIRDKNNNLLSVVRQIMMSKALYDQKNRATLIKHPIELLVGFVRTSGITLSPEELDGYLRELDQRPLLPPSVFGWNEKALGGESYVLAWRNIVLDMMNRSTDGWKEDRNYDFHDRFLAAIPAEQSASRGLIDRISSWFGLQLNETQKGTLDQFLNFDRDLCEEYHVDEYNCVPGEYFLRRSQFDGFKQGGNWPDKLQGALAIALTLPDYRVK